METGKSSMASVALSLRTTNKNSVKKFSSSDSGLETTGPWGVVAESVQPALRSCTTQPQMSRDRLLWSKRNDPVDAADSSSGSDDSCNDVCCSRTPLILHEPALKRNSAENSELQKKILQAKLQASRPKRKMRPTTKETRSEISKDDGTRNPESSSWGVVLAILSGILFTLSSAGIKLAANIDPTMLLLIRTVEQSIILLPVVVYLRLNPFQQRGYRRLLLLQGCIGCGVLVFIFIAFNRLPVGDATAIIFSSPVVVVVVSFIFFGEKCSILKIVALIFLMSGVTLISKPTFIFGSALNNVTEIKIQSLVLPAEIDNSNIQRPEIFYGLPAEYPVIVSTCTKPRQKRETEAESETSSDVFGFISALLGTLFMAMNYIVTRQVRQVHFACLLFSYSCISTVGSAVLVAATGVFKLPETAMDWAIALMIGITGLGGQVLLVAALRKETASTVSVVRCLDIVFAYVLQILFFADVPGFPNLCGAFSVGISVLFVTLENNIVQFCQKFNTYDKRSRLQSSI